MVVLVPSYAFADYETARGILRVDEDQTHYGSSGCPKAPTRRPYMGRKNVRTDEPTERIDTRILEVVVELETRDALIVGQRVMGCVSPVEPSAAPSDRRASR